MTTEKQFYSEITNRRYDLAKEIFDKLEDKSCLGKCPFHILFKHYKKKPSQDIIDFANELSSKNTFFDSETFVDNLDLLNTFPQVFKAYLDKIVVKSVSDDIKEHVKPISTARFYDNKPSAYKLADILVLSGYSEVLLSFLKEHYKRGQVPESIFSISKEYKVFLHFFFLDRKLTNEEIDALCEIIHFVLETEDTILFFSNQYIKSCLKLIEQKVEDEDDDSFRNRYELLLNCSFIDEDDLSSMISQVESAY